jgi:hypothetical protein
MLYLKASQSNTITVTWSERASSPTTYALILTSIAKNTSTTVTITASTNASSYTDRYDRFTFSIGALEKGQYKYEVFQDSNVRVIETGLAYIEPAVETYVAPTNNNTYVSF